MELFKQGRPGTGEDWAEKVASEIGGLLGIPHAEYAFAQWGDSRGVVTPTFVPPRGALVLGNEILAEFEPGYEKRVRFRSRQHTGTLIFKALDRMPDLSAPRDADLPAGVETPAQVFAGYLMLDALIGNTDRHHENWGIVYDAEGRSTLAPTFDHASSLGRNESDANRRKRLDTSDRGFTVAAYARRARSALYRRQSDAKAMGTVEAFAEGARLKIKQPLVCKFA